MESRVQVIVNYTRMKFLNTLELFRTRVTSDKCIMLPMDVSSGKSFCFIRKQNSSVYVKS